MAVRRGRGYLLKHEHEHELEPQEVITVHKKSLILKRTLAGSALVAATTLLAGCGGSDTNTTAATASLTLGITDTPVDNAAHVNVALTGVDLMGPNGLESHTFASERVIDLLTLQGNASETLLDQVTIPAGKYQWIRFNINTANSSVETAAGGQYPLNIPSSDKTGLKLVSGFTAAQGDKTDFIVDFDLRKALTSTTTGSAGTTYTMKPALRLIDNQQTGTISGTLAASVAVNGLPVSAPGCSPAVYAYDGAGVTPGGYSVVTSGAATPLTSATVKLDASSGNYGYTLGFMAPGDYTLALTCAANDVDTNTTLAFTGTTSVTVTADQTTTVNF